MGHRDPIAITVYRKHPGVYFKLSGSLTMQNFERALESLSGFFNDSPEHLYLMMSDLRYLDSAGLGMFVRLNARCRIAGCGLMLLNLTNDIARLFALSKMDQILSIESGSTADDIRRTFEHEAYRVELPANEPGRD